MHVVVTKSEIYYHVTHIALHLSKYGRILIMCSGGSRISRRGGVHPLVGGRGPPTWALFSENVCENERSGSHGGRAPGTPPRCANDVQLISYNYCRTFDLDEQ